MPFYIQCSNKGCCKNSAALLNEETNEVFCAECDSPIPEVTHFTKVQLKSMGQTMKKRKSQTSFSIQCQSCNKTDRPTIKDNKAYCKHCKQEMLNVSGAFIQMLKTIDGNS
jgi:Zn finger protein HypA/HybF involved in hydrogenase expression